MVPASEPLPPGWVYQSYKYALDLSPEQRQSVARHFGARRYAYNWAVARMKRGIEQYRAGVADPGLGKPNYYAWRQMWNQEKHTLCVDDAGVPWWTQASKEAYADGIRAAVEAYWRWHSSRHGKLAGRRVGFPRYKKRGRDRDHYTITTGATGLSPDRRHIKIPRLGQVRSHESTRKLERLLSKDRAKVLAITISRRGTRVIASVRVAVLRPQQARPRAGSTVGVDLGVHHLATVASGDGSLAYKVANPRPLEQSLAELRHLNKQRSRRVPGSIRYKEVSQRIAELHTHVANIRRHHVHVLTHGLAKNHGRIMLEDLSVAGMLAQKHLPGARSRRRGLSDAALAEPRRQLQYKCNWYGSELVLVDRYYPSSRTCSACGHVQTIGWARSWVCDECRSSHDRDINAAINLARWSPDQRAGLGGVAAPVKRGAARKTEPRSAAGVEARKNPPVLVGSTP